MRYLPLVLATALLAACKTSPELARMAEDKTPERPTAVQESVYSSTGLNGLAPFEGSVTVFTRADMQREQNTLRGTGTMSRLLVPGENRVQVTRLDLQRLWLIDVNRSEYRDCPLDGCPPSPKEEEEARQAARDSGLERGCTMRVVSRDVQVRNTGTRQQVSQWNAEQWVAELTMVLEDRAQRRSTSTLSAQLWTVPATDAMRAAREIEQRYETDAERAIRATAVRRVPVQLRELVDSLMAEALKAEDRNALFDLERDLAQVSGQPVRTTLSWDVRGNACGGMGLGPMARVLGAPAGAPLFSITHEVRRYEVAPVRDSQFQLSGLYKRRN